MPPTEMITSGPDTAGSEPDAAGISFGPRIADIATDTIESISREHRLSSQGLDVESPDYPTNQSTGFSHLTTVSGRQLEGVHLNSGQIGNLFRLFFESFHPHFPILSETLSIDEYYHRSSLLFWTIIAIAARASREEAGLCSSLVTALLKLLWSKISTMPHSHLTTQSIILLCIWPFSTPSMITDPTLMLISIAKTGCMHLGLHRPETMQSFNRVRFQVQPEQLEEAVKLWTGCFIAAETVTSSDGQEPLFASTDCTLRLASKEGNYYNLPRRLLYILRIQLYINKVNTTMSSVLNAHGHQPSEEAETMLASLEDDFHMVEQTIERDFSDTNPDSSNPDAPGYNVSMELIWASSARLQLQTYHFLQPIKSITRKQGLLRLYHTAMTVVSQMKAATASVDFRHCAPRYFGQMLKHAALVLMKILHSSYARLVDVDTGRHAFNLAISMHRDMTVETNDFHDRAHTILDHLWSLHRDSRSNLQADPTLKLNTRLSGSLLHDALWMWRDRYSADELETRRLGRPPRALPSIIQHSPSVTTSSREDTRKLIQMESDLGTTGGSAALRSNPDNAAMNDQISMVDAQMGMPISLDSFDMMNTYLAPDMEASGLFYPDWMWDDNFTGAP
ncbi:hypothetical protein PV08_09402 [Exophiala spinifera]|uniref:Xylanolytic transcriptional activator regulatory domain-containing protein n=1 Tax=Exophiala spinifera TaxID=91928 RepID=A0A0D1ZGN3_9EURO|nr:uncharacterized protein PV08_09402 [Exophiala spinifera]KIW12127.1 hypothetical protein PV08_09402 [Exophiala spinifera]